MKCPWCGITVPEMPEDATLEETLCNSCFDQLVEEEGEYSDNDIEEED
jgi:hypothetical protein